MKGRTRKKSRAGLWIALLVLLGVLAAGGWWFFTHCAIYR